MKKNTVNQIMQMSDAAVDKAVRIQKTQFDRRRHLSDKEISAIKRLRKDNHSYSYIASIFAVDARTIRALFDEEFYARRLAQANYGSIAKPLTKDEVKQILSERASYKRDLVVSGKLMLN